MSIAEALSAYASPVDAMLIVEPMMHGIRSLAEQQRTGLPDSHRVLAVLGLGADIELAALGAEFPDMGVTRSGGQWTVDARQFDNWCSARLSVWKRKAANLTPVSGRSLF